MKIVDEAEEEERHLGEEAGRFSDGGKVKGASGGEEVLAEVAGWW